MSTGPLSDTLIKQKMKSRGNSEMMGGGGTDVKGDKEENPSRGISDSRGNRKSLYVYVLFGECSAYGECKL